MVSPTAIKVLLAIKLATGGSVHPVPVVIPARRTITRVDFITFENLTVYLNADSFIFGLVALTRRTSVAVSYRIVNTAEGVITRSRLKQSVREMRKVSDSYRS